MSVSLMSDPICMLLLPELWEALLTVLTRPDQAGCVGDDLGTAPFTLTAPLCTPGEALATYCQAPSGLRVMSDLKHAWNWMLNW